MINLSIILPTLNEKDNLEILIPDLIANLSDINNLEFEIIISDDQSTDGTKELVELINLKNNNVFDVLDEKYITKILDKHYNMESNNTYQIYQILHFSYWFKNYS